MRRHALSSLIEDVDEANLVNLPIAKAEEPTLLPEYGIALLGIGLFALPILGPSRLDDAATWSSVCFGGLAVALALVTNVRLCAWQIWMQAGLGLGIAFVPVLANIEPHDWASLIGGSLIFMLAALQADCLDRAQMMHAQHRGWRAPSPIGGYGPRLIYSSEEQYPDRRRG
jgi:hypothetical protein